MKWLRRVFHIHRISDIDTSSAYHYITCRCGARKTRRIAMNRVGHPVRPEWPLPIDKWSQPVVSSPWIKELE